MSIVTTAQAVPSRLFSIYSSLFDSESGESKERLEAWATPPSLSARGAEEDGEATTTLFSNTLLEARKLGLVEDVDGKLCITSDARGGSRKGAKPEARFRTYLLRTLFDPLRAGETQQSGFMLALAWFLNTNPLEPMSFSDGPQNRLKAEIGDNAQKAELTNINRYQNFLYWARYLGFATIVGTRDDRRAIPDPVHAVASALPTIFADGAEVTIEVFMSKLAALFPVFEGGSARREFEAMLIDRPTPSARRLSMATSLALQRLADRQQIVLTSVADAPIYILGFGAAESRVSHIRRKNSA